MLRLQSSIGRNASGDSWTLVRTSCRPGAQACASLPRLALRTNNLLTRGEHRLRTQSLAHQENMLTGLRRQFNEDVSGAPPQAVPDVLRDVRAERLVDVDEIDAPEEPKPYSRHALRAAVRPCAHLWEPRLPALHSSRGVCINVFAGSSARRRSAVPFFGLVLMQCIKLELMRAGTHTAQPVLSDQDAAGKRHHRGRALHGVRLRDGPGKHI